MTALTELRDLVSSLAASEATPTWVDGMSLFRTTSVTEPLGTIAHPTLALVLQGAKQSALGAHVYDYRAGQFLIVTVDLPLVSQITRASIDEPFVAFGMPLQAPVVAQLLLEADGYRPPQSRRLPPAHESLAGLALAVSDADDELLGGIARLLRLAQHPADYRLLAPGIVRELHWRLMTGPQGGLVRQIGAIDSRLSLVSKAIWWIRENFDRALHVDELAAHVGVSTSTLNRHFRAATSLSPLQYQKTLRLQKARIDLIASPHAVGRIGHAVGYDSLSQFSREYRRMFGAPPSADAVRILEVQGGGGG